MGWQIVRHSFVLLFRNFPEALKVSVGPVLAGTLAVLLLAAALGSAPMLPMGPMAATEVDGPLALTAFGTLLVYLFVIAWVAVGWHRFVLLEDYPGMVPRLQGLPVLAYAGRALLVGVILVLAAVPVILVLGGAAGALGLAGSPGAAILISFAAGVVFTYLWLRIALVLPATAIGRPMTIREAWEVSGRASQEILQATFIAVALNALASILTQVLFGTGAPALVASLIVSWITLMVGTSLLTTLYGHLVEGRDLP